MEEPGIQLQVGWKRVKNNKEEVLGAKEKQRSKDQIKLTEIKLKSMCPPSRSIYCFAFFLRGRRRETSFNLRSVGYFDVDVSFFLSLCNALPLPWLQDEVIN